MLFFPIAPILPMKLVMKLLNAWKIVLSTGVPHHTFKALFEKNIEWATWGRKFAESQMVSLEERFINYQFQSGSSRYEKLLQEHPELFNRIKLQYVASYLRMTQVSLSRIRAGVQ